MYSRSRSALDEGDLAGAETWHRILNAIERLLGEGAGGGREGLLRRGQAVRLNQLELVCERLSYNVRRVH